MVPNVVGMSQHADGGLMTTKPYASGGAYINRMSDYCGGCASTPRSGSGSACPFTAGYWWFLNGTASSSPATTGWRRRCAAWTGSRTWTGCSPSTPAVPHPTYDFVTYARVNYRDAMPIPAEPADRSAARDRRRRGQAPAARLAARRHLPARPRGRHRPDRAGADGAPQVGATVFTRHRGAAVRHLGGLPPGHWSPRMSGVLKRLDHSNIFLIIAGTYTPFALLLLPPDQAARCC